MQLSPRNLLNRTNQTLLSDTKQYGTLRHCQMEPFRDLDSVFSVGSASATRENWFKVTQDSGWSNLGPNSLRQRVR